MTSIKRCTSVEQAGWPALRMTLRPAERHEYLEETRGLCAQTAPYAQLLAYSSRGEPKGLVEIALRSDDGNAPTPRRPLSWKAGCWHRCTSIRGNGACGRLPKARRQARPVIKKTGKTCV